MACMVLTIERDKSFPKHRNAETWGRVGRSQIMPSHLRRIFIWKKTIPPDLDLVRTNRNTVRICPRTEKGRVKTVRYSNICQKIRMSQRNKNKSARLKSPCFFTSINIQFVSIYKISEIRQAELDRLQNMSLGM